MNVMQDIQLPDESSQSPRPFSPFSHGSPTSPLCLSSPTANLSSPTAKGNIRNLISQKEKVTSVILLCNIDSARVAFTEIRLIKFAYF